MVHYRRNRVDGGTYFFTVTLRNRFSDALLQHVDLLRDTFRSGGAERPFTIDAIVILPEHLHTVWTLKKGDADYSGRWRAIKSRFMHALHATGVSLTRDNRGEYRLWQRYRIEPAGGHSTDWIRFKTGDFLKINDSQVASYDDFPWGHAVDINWGLFQEHLSGEIYLDAVPIPCSFWWADCTNSFSEVVLTNLYHCQINSRFFPQKQDNYPPQEIE